MDLQQERSQVHSLVDLLPPAKLEALRNLLELMVDDDDVQLTDDDRRALHASREYFRNGGEGIPFEQVVAECGFTMEQVRGVKSDQ